MAGRHHDSARLLTNRLCATGLGALLMLLCAVTAQNVAPTPVLTSGVAAAAGALTATQAPSAARASSKRCRINRKLVPSCHILQGAMVAPSDWAAPQISYLAYERMVGTHQNILHYYHQGSELFPTPWEQALTGPGSHRLLFVSWKPEDGHTWAEVAAGQADDYIDAEAGRITSTYSRPFFLAIHHEPEDEVSQTPGSGYTASDYAAMYRHVVDRLRADGVHNAVTVMQFMGAQSYAVKPWFRQLWPGNAYVDWVAFDPYQTPKLNGQHGGFGRLMNMRYGNAWPGEYRWAVREHPGKPIMLGEWGVAEKPGSRMWKAWFFRNVLRNLGRYPHLKAMVYWNQEDSSIQTSAQSLRAFRHLARSPQFRVGGLG